MLRKCSILKWQRKATQYALGANHTRLENNIWFEIEAMISVEPVSEECY